LEVDESSLTGEADAVHKNSHVVKIPDGKTLRRNLDLNERTNIVYMGTLIRNGTGRGVVVSIGEETEIGKVFAIMQDVEEKKSPLQVKMDELGVALTKMSFAIIAVICLLGFIQGKNYLELFTIAVSLAVAAIPEGLPIVVTVTLALGVLRMAKRKAIIRRMPAVEALGSLILIS
jgi:Ca2+-transporting ATPase